MSTSRRRFIEALPLAGMSVLAACSDKATPPAATPAPTPAPAPAPAAAPPAVEATAPPVAAAQATTPTPAPAPAPAGGSMPMLDPADPQAKSLGYVADASQADGAKFKSYAAGQACGNCALYGGKAGEASGPCPIYAGRQVSAKGWCSAYNKKTG